MEARLPRLAEREVGLLLITGKRVVLSASEIWQWFVCADCLIFWSATLCLVTFLFPVPTEVTIPWWIKTSGFAMFFAMIPACYFLQLILLSLIMPRFPRVYVFEPALLLLTVFLIEIADHKLSPVLFGQQWELWLKTATFGQQVAGDLIFMLTCDVLFCYFVVPRVLLHSGLDDPYTVVGPLRSVAEDHPATMAERIAADPVTRSENVLVDASPAAGEVTADTHAKNLVEIDGTSISTSSILAVEAEEHYVRVWTEEREIYARRSFGNLIAQLGDREGFSPRRGVWLSFHNISAIQRDESGKYIIKPNKGPVIVVPKAKAREVRQLIKQRPSLGAGESMSTSHWKTTAT